MVAQVAEAFPVIVASRYRSPHTYIFDAIDVAEDMLVHVLAGTVNEKKKKDTAREKATLEVSQRLQEEAEILAKLDQEVEFCDENMAYEKAKWEQKSKFKTLLKHPNLIEDIKRILQLHGKEAAHSRRRDNEAKVIGLGTRKIAAYLAEPPYETTGDDGEPLGHCTVWRAYKPSRPDDERSVRDGGRHGLLEVSLTSVRNSQFVKEHARGHWLCGRNRNYKEMPSDMKRRQRKVGSFHVDNLARLPLIIDACSHMHARSASRGCTLSGDGMDMFDHNQAVGRNVLMETTGVVHCTPPDEIQEINDNLGRPRLPRPRARMMCDFLRGVPQLEKDTSQYLHWVDIEQTWLTIPEEERPVDMLIIYGDNGSGFDPTDERNQHYAKKLMDKYNIKVIGLVSYAAGESARNFEIERPWAPHKKTVVGQRIGFNFVGGLQEPKPEDRDAFFEYCANELKALWEKHVTVSESNDSQQGPLVRYMPPLEATEVQEARRVFICFAAPSRAHVEKKENRDLLRVGRDTAECLVQSVNASWLFSPDCNRREMFGPTQQPFEPERFTAADGSIHFKTYLQQKEEYQVERQRSFTAPALQGREVAGLSCCGCTFRYKAKPHVCVYASVCACGYVYMCIGSCLCMCVGCCMGCFKAGCCHAIML